MLCSIILVVSTFRDFVKSASENDFNFLVQLNMMPQDMRTMLIIGFPRGFIGSKYGIAVIGEEFRSSEPVSWYKQLWNDSAAKTKCDLARDYPFNCFLFNTMASDFIKLLRFSQRGPRYLAPDPKDLTVNYIFQYCRLRTLAGLATTYDPRGYCPNPCFNKTEYCEDMQNTRDGECVIDVRYPHREDGFKCVCKEEYIWSVTARFCISNSSHSRPSDLGCSRRGTQSIVNSADQGFVCTCKKNYYGKKCENTINACKHPVSTMIAGNAACLVSKGNLCLSSEKVHAAMDPFYQCQCTENYKRINDFPQDNCLYQYKPCEKWICLHGTCVSGKLKQNARCICEIGWAGEHCDIVMMVNSTTPWNQWSICQPICGEARLRQRQRFCLSLFCDTDKFQEIRPCRSRSCNRYHHPDSRDKYIMDVQLSDDSRPETDFFILGLVICVISNVLMAAIFIQWRLIRPFIRLVGTRKVGMNKERDTTLRLPDEEPSAPEAKIL